MRAPTKCQKCDAQLTPGARGPLPTFCTGCRPSKTAKAGWSLYSCEICGDEFLRNHKRRVTCGQRCARLAKSGAAMESPASSYIARSDVGEKDSWICGICGEPVDKAIQWPDQQSPSIDHIIPLSKGGPHSMENLQISHLVCNVRKNNGTE